MEYGREHHQDQKPHLARAGLCPASASGKRVSLLGRANADFHQKIYRHPFFFWIDINFNLKEPKYQFADTAFSTLRSVLTKQDSLLGRQSLLLNVHLAITH